MRAIRVGLVVTAAQQSPVFPSCNNEAPGSEKSDAIADGTAQATPLQSDCQSVNESVSRIWPVAAAKAALIAADAGLGGSSTAPSGGLVHT